MIATVRNTSLAERGFHEVPSNRFSPNVSSRRRINELAGYSDTVIRLTDAALQNIEAISSFRQTGGLQRAMISLLEGHIAKLRQSRRDREGGIQAQERRCRCLRILQPSEAD
jgi:hypothetical protein